MSKEKYYHLWVYFDYEGSYLEKSGTKQEIQHRAQFLVNSGTNPDDLTIIEGRLIEGREATLQFIKGNFKYDQNGSR